MARSRKASCAAARAATRCWTRTTGRGRGRRRRERPGAAPRIHQREALMLDAAGTARATHQAAWRRRPRRGTCSPSWSSATRTARRRPCRRGCRSGPPRYLVGLKPEGWAASRERLKGQVAVVDVRGEPVAGAPVEVDVFARDLLLAPQAAGRRLLRLRARGGDPPRRPALPGRHRCQGRSSIARASRPPRGGSCCRRRRWIPPAAASPPTRKCGSPVTTSGGSRSATATASTSCRSSGATSPARPRACRCACRSARRRRWSPSSARACSTRASWRSAARSP